MSSWLDKTIELQECLQKMSVRDHSCNELAPDVAFQRMEIATYKMRANRGTIYLIGNGASASMASHVAADLAKNAHVHTQVFTDLSLITSVANDLCYEEIFAEPLQRRMVKDDMLVAISSSGKSPNIVRAVRKALELGGLVVTLSAMGADNPMRALGSLNFYVPANTYGLAETCHAAILHYWIDLVVITDQHHM